MNSGADQSVVERPGGRGGGGFPSIRHCCGSSILTQKCVKLRAIPRDYPSFPNSDLRLECLRNLPLYPPFLTRHGGTETRHCINTMLIYVLLRVRVMNERRAGFTKVFARLIRTIRQTGARDVRKKFTSPCHAVQCLVIFSKTHTPQISRSEILHEK